VGFSEKLLPRLTHPTIASFEPKQSNTVRTALEKDGWQITDDPLFLQPSQEVIALLEEGVLGARCSVGMGNSLVIRIPRFVPCPIHIEIQNGKIWIQRDFTEEGIANQLLEIGVPKTDIVLGFRAPYVRQFTEFSVS